VRLAGWAMGSKLGAVIPTVTWLVVVFALSTKRAEGDLVITGTFPGYLFLIGGSIAAMIAVALTPSPHSWLLRGANADAPAR
jgi:TRAP-type C4-dicarboxylate transport system permease large subunit